MTSFRTFTGALQDCDGAFQGVTGSYIASVEFHANVPDGTGIAVSRSLNFHWTATAP